MFQVIELHNIGFILPTWNVKFAKLRAIKKDKIVPLTPRNMNAPTFSQDISKRHIVRQD